MDTFRVTCFGLRLAGIVVLIFPTMALLARASYLLKMWTANSAAIARNEAIAWLTLNWPSTWPDRVGWILLFFLGLMLVFRNAWLARLLWKGLNAGLCPSCGYDRRGLVGVDAACPECGSKP